MACYEYKGVKYTEEDLVKLLQSQQLKTRRILELQSDLFQKGRGKEDLVSKKGKYYRVLNINLGKDVTFEPKSYSEAFEQGEDGKWYPKYNKYGGYWRSSIPEISASKNIGSAVMGNWTASGMPQTTEFFIYELEDGVEPDYDISHLEIGDFKQLQEVRYRNPVKGKLIGEFKLTPDIYKIFNENYDLMSEDGGINKHYELEDEFEKKYGYKPYDEKVPEGAVEIFNKIQDDYWKEQSLKVEKALQSIHNKYDEQVKQNQFLQLLNKDSNWVTFFLKAVLQDSAKKGYEKILFPTGRTASLIEGHTTLEEFKREKENRIKLLESEVERKKNYKFRGDSFTVDKGIGWGQTDEYTNLGNGEYYKNGKLSTEQEYETALKQHEDFVKKEGWKKEQDEINQLKQELERVETEGFSALKPIYNFYENTVANILKKQGYTPILITDEYGNTWNEIEIKDNYSSPIFLSASKNYLEEVLSPEELIIFKRLQSSGLISKKAAPFELNNKPVYTIPKNEIYGGFQKDYNKKQALDSFIRRNNIDFLNVRETRDAFIIQIDRDKPMTSLDSMEETKSSTAGQITKDKVMSFLKNIGFSNIQYVNKLMHNGNYIDGDAYVDVIKGIMQIVNGKEDVTLPEEAMHILVELIENSDSKLFRALEKDVVNYELYRKLINDPAYINSKFYQKKDGSLDHAKLKKEAIAKLLAEQLINNLEGTIESDLKLARIKSLWRDIINWIKSVFTKYKNPFEEAINRLNEDESQFGRFEDLSSTDNLFLSASKTVEERDNEYQENKKIFEDIRKKFTTFGITKVNDEYYQNGQKLNAKRVSSFKDDLYEKLFKNKPISEELKEKYKDAADEGKLVHSIFEESVKAFIDIETGLLKQVPSKLSSSFADTPLKKVLANEIYPFIKRTLSKYPEGTRFTIENIVYDPNKSLIGTIDFVAVLPDGTTDILDWKTVDSVFEVKDYKAEGYIVQINKYKEVLSSAYGVKKFGKLRAIPIRRIITENDKGEYKMIGIELQNSKGEDRGLRDIISDKESTGDRKKDAIIRALMDIRSKFIERLKNKEGISRDVLMHLSDAIYDLRAAASIKGLSVYLSDVQKKLGTLIKEIEKENGEDRNVLDDYLSQISLYESIYENLKQSQLLYEDERIKNSPEYAILNSNLQSINARLVYLNEERGRLLNLLAKSNGVHGLTDPEKIVAGAARMFRSMGNQDIASVRLLYELTKKSYNRITLETDTELKTLEDLKYKFEQYAKKNNLSVKQLTEKFVNTEKGTLFSKISRDFYEQRQKVFDSRDKKKILNFVKTNYDIVAWEEWYKKELKDLVDFLKDQTYSTDEQENISIKKLKIKEFKTNYDVLNNPLTAFNRNNSLVWSKNIKEDLWLSKEYQELSKPGNEDLFEIYNFFIKKNKEIAKTGAIEEWQAYTFLPNVKKGLAETFSFKDKDWLSRVKDTAINEYENFKSKFTVDDYELNFSGKTDPITGKALGKRYVPFVNSLNYGEKSLDLFSIYGLMSKEIAKEKYLQENDEVARALVHLEKNKPHFETNKFGNLVKDGAGNPIVSYEKDTTNAKILEQHVKYLVEGQSLQVDNDYAITVRFREKWNNSKLSNLYKFKIDKDYNPTNVSVTKTVMWLNNLNQKRVLGLNLSSAISNLFGGLYSANKLYKKYISNDDLMRAHGKVTSVAFYQSEEMKKNAALVDYFLPLLNNREQFKSSQLSVNQATRILSQEWIMSPQRKTEEIVQLNIFLALLDNTGLINGQLVNLRQMAMEETGYFDRYSKDSTERSETEKKFEEKLKELKDKYSVTKLAEFKKIQRAGKEETVVEIPGVDRFSETVEKLREISQTMSKDALGSMDEFDQAGYRYSLIMRLFMTFKNWIPRMADVRWSEFHYSQSHHSYEYGRVRMFYRGVSANLLASMSKIVPFTKSIGKEDYIKRAKEIYQEKKEMAKNLAAAGENFNEEEFDKNFITEGEFVDMFLYGLEAQFAEFRTLTLVTLALMMGILKGDDDDDPEEKSAKRILRRQLDKMGDEVGFFYSAKSLIDIAGQAPPIMGFVQNLYSLTTHFSKEVFGLTIEGFGFKEEGEQIRENAKPLKYTFKAIPVLKEILTFIPIFNNDMAKDWGIKIQDRRGF